MPNSEEDPDDGWTHVGRKKGARPTFTQPVNPADNELTIEKITREFNRNMATWRRSSCRQEGLEMINKHEPDEGWQIEKAVCLGSGSFSRDNVECRKRTMLQFALFMDVVQHLRKSASAHIECFVQDPKYTALDYEFLYSLGVTALECSFIDIHRSSGPAKHHLGPKSVVFDLFMDMEPWQMRDLFTCNLKLYIGSSMQGRVVGGNGMTNGQIDEYIKSKHIPWFEELGYVPDHHVAQIRQESSLVKQFHADYRACRWPRFEEDPNVLEGLMMYWQEPKDEDDET